MVPFGLHRVRQRGQLRNGRQEHRRRLAPLPGTHEAAHGLGEEERRGRGSGVDAHGKPGNVHAFGHHADGHHPALFAGGEFLDLAGCLGVVGKDDGGRFAGDLLQLAGVGAGVVVVGGDHQAAGVGHGPADLAEAFVRPGQHGRDPFAGRVERGAPGLRDDVLGDGRLAEGSGHLLAAAGAPAHLSGVGHEHDGTDHVVPQGVPVAVGVVGLGAADAVPVLGVLHERDGRGVGAERRSRQGQPACCRIKGLAEAVAPGQGFAAVVDFVQDHQGPGGLGLRTVQHGLAGHLGVGDRHADEAAAVLAVGVLEVGVDRDPHLGRGVSPLAFQVVRGRHDGHAVHGAGFDQHRGHPQGEGGLAGAGCCDGQEVLGAGRKIAVERLLLPGTELRRGAPRCPFGVGRWQRGPAKECLRHAEPSIPRIAAAVSERHININTNLFRKSRTGPVTTIITSRDARSRE